MLRIALLLLIPACVHADVMFSNFGLGDTFDVPALATRFQPVYDAPAAGFTVPESPGNQAWEINSIDVAITSPNAVAILILMEYAPGFACCTNGSFSQILDPVHPLIVHATGFFGKPVFPGDRLVIWPEIVPNQAEGLWHLNLIGDIGPVATTLTPSIDLQPGIRPAFRVIATPIPEPASIILVGTAILGVVFLLKRRFLRSSTRLY